MLLRQMEIHLNRGGPGVPGMPSQLPNLLLALGAGCFLLGLLLIWNENLLRWLVAGMFLTIGAFLGLAGLRTRRMFG